MVNKLSVKVSAPRMIPFVLSAISVNLYNDRTGSFVDRMGRYFSSLLIRSWLFNLPEARELNIEQCELDPLPLII